MPRYVIERTFPKGVQIPQTEVGARVCRGVVANNLREGVTWLLSYVTSDRGKTFCIYEAPSPEAIRSVAEKNGLPVDNITEVSVLDPYFFRYEG